MSIGWVLAVYLFYWYTRKKQWERRRRRSGGSWNGRRQTSATSFCGVRRPTSPGDYALFPGRGGGVMSVLDCVPGMLMVVALFGVQMLSYLARLRVLNQRF